MRKSREKSLAHVDKENLYEQLQFFKRELNSLKKETTQMRTRNQIFIEQLKAKDKLIDEIIKNNDATNVKMYIESQDLKIPEEDEQREEQNKD